MSDCGPFFIHLVISFSNAVFKIVSYTISKQNEFVDSGLGLLFCHQNMQSKLNQFWLLEYFSLKKLQVELVS